MDRRKFIKTVGMAGAAAAFPWQFNLKKMVMSGAPASAFAQTPTFRRNNMRTVDIEHHFMTKLFVESLRSRQTPPRMEDGKGLVYFDDTSVPNVDTGSGVESRLMDLGEGRLKEMDTAGIDVAVLSLTAPGVEALDAESGAKVARDANDRLAAYVKKYPERLRGMATIAPKDTDSAVRELRRCVRELGFKGWHTHSNFGDSYLDEKRYWPILAKAEELNVPIYLHPTVPIIPELRTFGICLSGPTFGFGTEVMFVFLRMIFRGVFDEFPKLKVILGHFGEGMPFMLNRIDTGWRQGAAKPNPDIGPGSKHPPSYYVLNNMWATTSGNYLAAAYYCTRDALGLDKVMLATDYPYEKFKDGPDFIKALPVSEREKARVCAENVVKLGLV